MIDTAVQELAVRLNETLTRERLITATSEIPPLYSTPRRLGLLARSLADRQPDIEERITGPSLKAAYKEGQPAAPAQAFAKRVGLELSQLEKITTPKGEYLSARVLKKGRSAVDILKESVPSAISSVNWPKNMYWRKTDERFVRPIRWLVAMLDGEVVPLEFMGVHAGSISQGHRTLGHPVQIGSAGSYESILETVSVRVKRAKRENTIEQGLHDEAASVSGAPREDTQLLGTVTDLTEWPSVILGSFDPEFLALPEEVLVTVMRDHQKYFAVEDSNGKLLPHFLAVLNTDGDPRGIIRHGHERVLRARFNDARFFWETDQKHPLRERLVWLKNVTFQKDLGSYYEKTQRVQRLCSWLCENLRQHGTEVRSGIVHKAACLSKTDLTTELVKEFTELQGIVGGLYARVQQLDVDMPEANRQAIAQAVYDHYKPESMEDSVPRSVESAVLSICDKVDTIAGMFALGLQPTGSKDPFALRRQANGIIKTIAEHKLPISLGQLFRNSRQTYRGSAGEKKFRPEDSAALQAFLRERLEFYLRDHLGFKYDVVNAVLAAGSDDVVDAVARTEAVTTVRPSADFESISIAAKRIKNILRQATEAGKGIGEAVEVELLRDDAEQELARQISEITKSVESLRAGKMYEQALVEISKIRGAVDRFFDKVMVMVDDEAVRANRLALLRTLLREFSTIADFSEIVTEGGAKPLSS